MCSNCIQIYIDSNNKIQNGFKCPFCKKDVHNFVKLNITLHPKCMNCDNTISYYGECLHPISCKKCINDIIQNDQVECNICNKNVKLIKIYFC